MPFADSAEKYRTKKDAKGQPIPGYVDPSAVMDSAMQGIASSGMPGGAALVGLHKAAVKKASEVPGGQTALTMISDAIEYMEGGLAGAMGYAKKHKDPRYDEFYSVPGVVKAFKKGSERRASYQEVFGPSGVYLDIFGPMTSIAGEGAGMAMRAAGLPALRAGARAAGKHVPEPVKAMAAQVNKPYAYKRMGIEEGLDIESELAGKHHQARGMKPTQAEKEILRLVPDPEGLKRLSMAVEDGDLQGLTAAEQQAYPLAQQLRDKIEQDRLTGKTISKETAAGLKDKMNAEYFPHIILPPKERIVSLDKAISEYTNQGKDPSYLKTLRDEAVYDSKSKIARWAERSSGKRPPSFTKERTSSNTIRNMGDVVHIVNTNAAEAMGIARQETAKGIALREYFIEYQNMLKGRGIAINHEAPGYSRITPKFPGMDENLYVPDNVHKAIMGTVQRIANPEDGLLTGIAVLDSANRLFRNWNLFLRPGTLTMNAVGNVFNNYSRLDMGPESVIDYVRAGEFLSKKKLGRLDMAAPSGIANLTNGQLSNLLERERITGTGWSHETGYLSGQKKTMADRAKGIAGSESILLEPGKAAFTAIEDWHRASAFFNQMKMGLTPRQAARNVFDSMFDYEHGLTGFEKDVLRRALPFYSWTRFNLPLQLRMLATHPERYVNMARLAAGIQKISGGPQPDESKWSEYERSGTPLRYGYDEATGTYKTKKLDNLVPGVQAVSLLKPQNAVKYIEGGLTPAASIPWQLFDNRDWFRSTPDKPVKIQNQKGEVKNVLGVNLPSKVAWAAMQVPPVRLAQQARQQLQKGKGVKGAVERVSLPYTTNINQQESEDFAKRRIASESRVLGAAIARWTRQLNDKESTPDQKKEAQANIKNIRRLMEDLQRQSRAQRK